jgi:tetratricopeptide (TPR) repeat protein
MGSRFSRPLLKRRGRQLAETAGRSIGTRFLAGLLARIVAVALVGSLSLVAHAAPPLKPKSSKARAHFEKAIELYKAEDFDAAAAEANAGLAIEEHESLLFILAQAERQRGNCVEAVEILTKFIEMTQSEDGRQNALSVKALCAEELAEIARKAELERQAAEQAEAEADAETEPPPPPPKVEPATPWYRDPLGGALVGVGGVAVLAGSAVLITAAVLDPEASSDYGTFDERRQLRPKLLLAGGLTAGLGALVGAGGAVRWVLLAKKNKDTAPVAARIQFGPWLDRRRAGVVLSGRF